MLRDDAAYFSSRYEHAVREPDAFWQRWVEQGAAGEERALFVAEEGGVWAGVVGAFVRVDPTEAQLISMWVDPRSRGRGIARALIRRVAAWARDRGCDRVFLFVQEANDPARALYERAGFTATGEKEPVAGGRRGFKLVLSATTDALLDR
jgi:ribosomal protein S18 acetylase RimI-like enzyme